MKMILGVGSPFIQRLPQQPMVRVRFGGANNFASSDAQAEKALLETGLTKEKLKRDWDVTLWRILAIPGKRVILAVEPGGATAEQRQSVTEALTKALSHLGEVMVRFQSIEEACCGGACRGCAASSRSDRHNTWIA